MALVRVTAVVRAHAAAHHRRMSHEPSSSTIAVLGLGAMGTRIAERLLAAGHEVTVWNRTAATAEPFIARGARVATTPADAATSAGVVISMVRDDEASLSVWSGASGALGTLSESAIGIECSTLSPTGVQRLAAAFEHAGRHLLEVPVLGSRPQVEAGALVGLVGGEATTLGRVRTVLSTFCGSLHHVGPHGRAAIGKLAVNALMATQIASLAEMLRFVRAGGIADDAWQAIVSDLPIFGPRSVGAHGAMIADQHEPNFPVELVEKDLAYCLDVAKQLALDVAFVARTHESFRTAREAGHGDDNITAVMRVCS